MPAITDKTPQLAKALTDTLVLESMALHQRAARQTTQASEHRDMADRLGAAIAQKKVAMAHGKGGPRGPTGHVAWYGVEERGSGLSYTQSLADVGAWLGVSKGTLQVYMNRGGGAYKCTISHEGREDVLTVRRVVDNELAALKEAAANSARAEDIPLWSPPSGKVPQRTTAKARRKKRDVVHSVSVEQQKAKVQRLYEKNKAARLAR